MRACMLASFALGRRLHGSTYLRCYNRNDSHKGAKAPRQETLRLCVIHLSQETSTHMTTSTNQTTLALLDAIRSRRSFALNQLSPEPIDLAAIPPMLEAARWAPNHGLTEPWRFTVFAGARRQALS